MKKLDDSEMTALAISPLSIAVHVAVQNNSGAGGFTFTFPSLPVCCLSVYVAHFRYARFSGLGFGFGICSARQEFGSDGFSSFSGLSAKRMSGDLDRFSLRLWRKDSLLLFGFGGSLPQSLGSQAAPEGDSQFLVVSSITGLSYLYVMQHHNSSCYYYVTEGPSKSNVASHG
ncbi:unnamed protein product [Brassica oleracea]|uniref:Uncharacterized protein n=1 Tax=Brassica oleracea TaxID=3712 RepID=A0A3P6EYJ2_BRAOL|nr:unnamed protein product [Brassica oleracea]